MPSGQVRLFWHFLLGYTDTLRILLAPKRKLQTITYDYNNEARVQLFYLLPL